MPGGNATSDDELSSSELTEYAGYYNSQNTDQTTTSAVNALVTGTDQGKKDVRKLIRAIVAALKLLGG